MSINAQYMYREMWYRDRDPHSNLVSLGPFARESQQFWCLLEQGKELFEINLLNPKAKAESSLVLTGKKSFEPKDSNLLWDFPAQEALWWVRKMKALMLWWLQ